MLLQMVRFHFLMAEQYSIIYIYICICVCVYIYIYHIFFIHSSVDGHLGSFHSLAIVDIAAVNTGVQVSLNKINTFVSLG